MCTAAVVFGLVIQLLPNCCFSGSVEWQRGGLSIQLERIDDLHLLGVDFSSFFSLRLSREGCFCIPSERFVRSAQTCEMVQARFERTARAVLMVLWFERRFSFKMVIQLQWNFQFLQPSSGFACRHVVFAPLWGGLTCRT